MSSVAGQVTQVIADSFPKQAEEVREYISSVINEGVDEATITDAKSFQEIVGAYMETYELVDCEKGIKPLSDKLFKSLVAAGVFKHLDEAEADALEKIAAGAVVMTQYWEDEQWYMATVKEVDEGKQNFTVTFNEYGNEEVVEREYVKALNFKHKHHMLDVAVRIADYIDNEEDQKNQDYLASLTMTVKGRYFGDTVDDRNLAAVGLTSKQKKKQRKEQKKLDRLAEFDPEVYYRKSRQKARKEWLEWEKNTAIDINITEYNLYTLDDKQVLLSDCDIKLAYGRAYGLIGKNGTGKTTLLRRLSRYDIDEFPKHVRIFHCEQEIRGDDSTVIDYVMDSDVLMKELKDQEEDLIRAQEKDAEPEVIAKKLTKLYEIMNIFDVSGAEQRAKEILTGLHFDKEMLQWPTKRLSGGWRMRVALASALFVNPDILLLDEPTNHLDFPSVVWLENYLKDLDKTLIIVSHDRHFLNNVVDSIIYLDDLDKTLKYYKGSYATFEKTRLDEYTCQLKAYKAQQAQMAHIQSFINKFRANPNRAPMVQSRIKMLNAMEKIEEPRSPDTGKILFKFPECDPASGPMVQITDLLFGYAPDKILLNKISCAIEPTARIGMIGANGAGKSTFIKLIVQQLSPLHGECNLNRQCGLSVFTQHHIDQLDLTQNAVEFFLEKFAGDLKNEQRKAEVVRKYLGRFGFSGELVSQRMFFLSGGQKSRVAFAALTWRKPSFVILDEPTNHLDMETIDALVHAVKQYRGGILVVSHDQYFLQSVANVYWALAGGKIHKFEEFSDAKAFATKM